jgi:hypothetical protein
MHYSMQQTPLFINHGLHPKCNIQGVHKVVNPTTKDQTTCDTFSTSLIDSNVSLRWKQWNNEELGHTFWLAALWG